MYLLASTPHLSGRPSCTAAGHASKRSASLPAPCSTASGHRLIGAVSEAVKQRQSSACSTTQRGPAPVSHQAATGVAAVATEVSADAETCPAGRSSVSSATALALVTGCLHVKGSLAAPLGCGRDGSTRRKHLDAICAARNTLGRYGRTDGLSFFSRECRCLCGSQ